MIEQVSFNKIFIIQSLRNDERQTGYAIESAIRIIALKTRIEVQLIDVSSAPEFFNLLQNLANAHVSVFPYIHIEAHGSENGLHLSNGDVIKWEGLKELLLEINRRCKNNLFISIAACHGGRLLKIIKPYEPCPIYGYVGPEKEVTAFYLEVSYVEYFQTLLAEGNFDTALTKLPTGFAFLNYRGYFELLMKHHTTNTSYREEWYKKLRANLKEIDANKEVSDEEIDQHEREILDEMRATYFSVENGR